MAKRGRTLYVRVRGRPCVERWLALHCVASTGPYPCISGMRKLYWGQDALVVKAGIYIYNMGRDKGQVLAL